MIAAVWSDWRCDRDDGCRIFTALVDDEAVGRARVVQWQNVRSVLRKDTVATFELLLIDGGGWQVRVGRALGERQLIATIGASFGAHTGVSHSCGDITLHERLRVVAPGVTAEFGCFASAGRDLCIADDQCVPAGTRAPDNTCLVCNSSGFEPVRDGPCDDGQRCTVNDNCLDGTCRGTPPRACDDELDCTIDSCTDVPGGASCTHEPAPGACLIDGACVANGAIHKDNPCLVCDASASATSWSPRTFVACDDGDSCTADDVCDSGVCAGTDLCGEAPLLALGATCVDDADCASARCADTPVSGDVCCGVAEGCCAVDDDCAGADICGVDHVCRVVATPAVPGDDNDDDDDDIALGGGGCTATGSSSFAALLGVALLRRRRMRFTNGG